MGLGCSAFARHYLRNHFVFFSSGYWDVSLHRVSRSHLYIFKVGLPGMTLARLPHSEISGSKRACRSPKLIAAYHVLHRLLAPRRSPCALTSLFLINKLIETHIFYIRQALTPDFNRRARKLDSYNRSFKIRRLFEYKSKSQDVRPFAWTLSCFQNLFLPYMQLSKNSIFFNLIKISTERTQTVVITVA